jgi:hypothetical protein
VGISVNLGDHDLVLGMSEGIGEDLVDLFSTNQ